MNKKEYIIIFNYMIFLTLQIILLFIYLFIFLPLSISVKKKSLDVFSNSKNHWIGFTSNHEFDFRRLD